MNEPIILSAHLQARGQSRNEIANLRRQGDLVRIRRGAYVRPSTDLTLRERHEQLVRANVAVHASAAVVSHVSAAVLQGLPIWNNQLQRAHFTIDRSTGARLTQWAQLHATHSSPMRFMRSTACC